MAIKYVDTIKEEDVIDVIKTAICSPVVVVNGEVIPVYDYVKAPSKEIEVAYKKKVGYSPNSVYSVLVGYDGVIKNFYGGRSERVGYTKGGLRVLEAYTESQFIGGSRSIKSILAPCVDFRNIEELYIDKMVLSLAGLRLEKLQGLDGPSRAKMVSSPGFCKSIFGVESKLFDKFNRLRVLQLSDLVIDLSAVNSNWVDGRNERLVVEVDTYKSDVELRRRIK